MSHLLHRNTRNRLLGPLDTDSHTHTQARIYCSRTGKLCLYQRQTEAKFLVFCCSEQFEMAVEQPGESQGAKRDIFHAAFPATFVSLLCEPVLNVI